METIRLYRGLEHPIDFNYKELHKDTPCGYTCWTDNIEYASLYGRYLYYVDVPVEAVNYDDIFDCNSDRCLCFVDYETEEYTVFCIYEYHEDYGMLEIKEV